MIDICIEKLAGLKLDLQIKLGSKKPSISPPMPPMPPPLPNLLQPTQKTINIKTIAGLSVTDARPLLNHVLTKKHQFDFELAATAK